MSCARTRPVTPIEPVRCFRRLPLEVYFSLARHPAVRYSVFGVLHSMTERGKRSVTPLSKAQFAIAVTIDGLQVGDAAQQPNWKCFMQRRSLRDRELNTPRAQASMRPC